MSQAQATPAVSLRAVRREFQGGGGVHGVDLDIQQGEFFSLLGPSGCGKTTTLRLIAGFERPDNGTVQILGRDVTRLDPRHRPTAMVFQRLALFPHMTVRQNVGFGLRAKRVPEPARSRRVRQALERVEMQEFADRLPATLSGGQQQRVAVARALAIEPAVLLLDEPLAALDRKLRHQLQDELKSLQERVGTTFIFVTHDQEEALKLSDRIALMHDGLVEQADTPGEIFRNPATRWAASFMGSANWLAGQVVAKAQRHLVVKLVAGPTIEVPQEHSHPAQLPAGAEVEVMVRPEHLGLTGGSGESAQLPATIVEGRFMGSHIAVRLALAGTGQQLHAALPPNGYPDLELTPGRQVGLRVEQPLAHLYASESVAARPTTDRAG